jgi:hypothetical protein
MHGPINVKFPNNTSKWQMGFNWRLKVNVSVLFLQSVEQMLVQYSDEDITVSL